MEGDIRMPSTSTHARAKRPKGSGRSLLQSEEKDIIYKIYNLIKELAENPESVTMIDFSKVPHLTIQMCGIPSVTVKDVCEKASMSKEKILKSSDSRKHCNFYIYNTFKFLKELAEHPEKIASVDFRKSQGLTAELCGISMRTVQRVCKEASVSTEPSPKFSSPRITVKRKCYVTALSDSEKDIIRSEINDFTKDGECPTRAKLREILRDKVGYSGSLTSVARIVKDLGLEYRKYDGKRVLMQVRTSPVASSEYITDGALAEKTTSLDFETVLSEASESRLGECDPLLIQDESLPSMPRPSSSVNVVPLPVAITPPLQPNDIPDEDESTLDAPETFEHQLQDFKKDFIEGKMINGALQKLDEVCDKFDRLTHGEDEYDHFGIYVVSLLRHCPYQQAILLQKKIINLILESQTYTLESGQMNEESPTHIFRNETSNKSENSKLHNSESTHFAVEDETSVKVQESSLLMDITPSATVMSQPLPICPTQSCELSELTRFSLSVQEDKSNGRGECRTFVDTSETHSHHLSDEFITNKNCIDDSLRKLDDMSEKFNMLDQKEHGVINFDHFGKYVASLLRRHPLGRAIVIEKKIIDFIWKAHVEPMLHVSGTI